MSLPSNNHADVPIKTNVLRVAHCFAGLAPTRRVYRATLDRATTSGACAWRIWQTLRHGKRMEFINSEATHI